MIILSGEQWLENYEESMVDIIPPRGILSKYEERYETASAPPRKNHQGTTGRTRKEDQ